MTQQFAVPEPQFAAPEALPVPLYMRMGDILVILSATLVSLAGGAWLIAQLGFELSHAILAALGAYCVLLLLHVVARRALSPKDADSTAAVDDEDDVHWQTGAAAFEAALARQAAQATQDEASAAADEAASDSRVGSWPDPLPMPEPEESDAAQAFKYRPSRLPYFETADETDAPAAADRPGSAKGRAAPRPGSARHPPAPCRRTSTSR